MPEMQGTIIAPVVSKRGFHLAFVQQTTERGIHQLDLYPPGQSARPLIETSSGNNAGAQISPDGSKIVYVSATNGNADIYVINSDGGVPVQLTNNVNTDLSPVWSPDGKKIVFASNRDGNFEIYIMDADGGNQVRVTNNTVDDTEPNWSR